MKEYHFFLIVFPLKICSRALILSMDERIKYVEVPEFINFPKVTDNPSNLAYCCGGTKLNIFLEYKFAIHGKNFKSIFFHIAASVLSNKTKQKSLPFMERPLGQFFFIMLPVFDETKQKNVPNFFLCFQKKIF